MFNIWVLKISKFGVLKTLDQSIQPYQQKSKIFETHIAQNWEHLTQKNIKEGQYKDCGRTFDPDISWTVQIPSPWHGDHQGNGCFLKSRQLPFFLHMITASLKCALETPTSENTFWHNSKTHYLRRNCAARPVIWYGCAPLSSERWYLTIWRNPELSSLEILFRN